MTDFGAEELALVMRAGLAEGEAHVKKASSLFPFGETPYQRAVVSQWITRDLESRGFFPFLSIQKLNEGAEDLMTDERLESAMPVEVVDRRQPFEFHPALEHIEKDIDSSRKWGRVFHKNSKSF